eukprot:Skav211760  [mRNA]  locus=scaffold674:179795:181981:+ [translate_table: standard]
MQCLAQISSHQISSFDICLIASSNGRPGRGRCCGLANQRGESLASTPKQSLASDSPAGSSTDRPSDSRRRFENLISGAYITITQEQSAAHFRSMVDFARLCGGCLPVGQDSDHIFNECKDLIAEHLLEECLRDVKASPYYAVSIDEKDRFLVCLVSFFRDGHRTTLPLAYRDLPGFEAADIAKQVQGLLEAWGLDKECMVAFTADGASVMGTRVALGARGDNVAKRLSRWAGHPLLVTHCAPHRFQLCVAASWTDEYLKTLERQIKALYKNLVDHPSATIDLVFWSDLTSEDVLPSLSTSGARWLSFLQPVQKLLKSWVSILCHLMYQFKHHANHEQKKTVSWLFQGLATWEARLTLAGVADILEVCFRNKNRLEKVGTLSAVQEVADSLKAELDSYCRKNSVVAAAMSNETALPGGNTQMEAMCSRYRREAGQKLHLLYVAAGRMVDEWVTIKDITDKHHMRSVFQRLQGFAETCGQKVMERFEAKEVWAHGHVFHQAYKYEQESFQTAIWEMGSYLNLPTEELISEMRAAFGMRDAALERFKFESAEALWSKVLVSVKEADNLPLAERLIASFLLAPSQAAACERAFSTIVRVRQRLGPDSSPTLLEQYLQVGAVGKPVHEAKASLSVVCKKFLAKKNRHDTAQKDLGFYTKGKQVVQRKRKRRSDTGIKRPVYKTRKKHAGLRAQSNARLLVRGEGELVEMAEAPGDEPEHAIWEQMSPRRKPKQ